MILGYHVKKKMTQETTRVFNKGSYDNISLTNYFEAKSETITFSLVNNLIMLMSFASIKNTIFTFISVINTLEKVINFECFAFIFRTVNY